MQNNFEKQSRRLTLPHFKNYYKAIVIKIVKWICIPGLVLTWKGNEMNNKCSLNTLYVYDNSLRKPKHNYFFKLDISL